MAWNNGNYRRNDNWGGGGYGYDRGRYDDRDRRDNRRYDDRDNRDRRDNYDQRPMKFDVGQKCFLKDYPDTTVSIIRLGREQYECRLPNLTTAWFYEHELSPVEEN